MQQTEKYHFNLIDPSDEFSPDPLNDNASKLETALASHESAVQSALDAHRTEVQSALTAQDAAIAKNCLFKLGGPVNRGDTPGEASFSISGASGYAALVLTAVGASHQYFGLYANSTDFGLSRAVTPSMDDTITVVLQPSKSYIGATVFLHNIGASEDSHSVYVARVEKSWSSLTSIRVTNILSATLYGLKL